MDKVKGFKVEIEYGEMDLKDCLKNLLDSLSENCNIGETEIEIADSIR